MRKEKGSFLKARADAIAPCIRVLETAGFKLVRLEFDGNPAQPHAVSLERAREGEVDFIRFVFDKNGRGRFQVLGGTKRSVQPFEWVRSGDLVRWPSNLVEAKWWGGPWWHLQPVKRIESRAAGVVKLLPQILAFLTDGSAGPNIYRWPTN